MTILFSFLHYMLFLVLPNNQIGGLQPEINLEGRQVKCSECRRKIGDGCCRFSIMYLRGLLNAKTEYVGFESISELILTREQMPAARRCIDMVVSVF